MVYDFFVFSMTHGWYRTNTVFSASNKPFISSFAHYGFIAAMTCPYSFQMASPKHKFNYYHTKQHAHNKNKHNPANITGGVLAIVLFAALSTSFCWIAFNSAHCSSFSLPSTCIVLFKLQICTCTYFYMEATWREPIICTSWNFNSR